MSHYAKVENGIVTQVIVAEEDFIQTGALGDPAGWIQTSYNTHGGQHSNGGTPLRKNYAGIGYSYDTTRDAFIPPQTYPSWTLNQDTCLWDAPFAMPQDEYFYTWNEDTISWDRGELRPVVEVVVEPTPEPLVETVVETVSEPVVESAPVTETVVEPEVVVETPAEPTAETLVEPTAETPTTPAV